MTAKVGWLVGRGLRTRVGSRNVVRKRVSIKRSVRKRVVVRKKASVERVAWRNGIYQEDVLFFGIIARNFIGFESLDDVKLDAVLVKPVDDFFALSRASSFMAFSELVRFDIKNRIVDGFLNSRDLYVGCKQLYFPHLASIRSEVREVDFGAELDCVFELLLNRALSRNGEVYTGGCVEAADELNHVVTYFDEHPGFQCMKVAIDRFGRGARDFFHKKMATAIMKEMESGGV